MYTISMIRDCFQFHRTTIIIILWISGGSTSSILSNSNFHLAWLFFEYSTKIVLSAIVGTSVKINIKTDVVNGNWIP